MEPGKLVVDSGHVPDFALDEARRGKVFLDTLRGVKDLDWTTLSPSALLTAGERTGKFRLGADGLLVGADGKSWCPTKTTRSRCSMKWKSLNTSRAASPSAIDNKLQKGRVSHAYRKFSSPSDVLRSTRGVRAELAVMASPRGTFICRNRERKHHLEPSHVPHRRCQRNQDFLSRGGRCSRV
jgi:hypothetical protein